MACAHGRRQLLPQAQVRSGHIIEGMEEAHPFSPALAVVTEAGRLTRQWCQGLTQGQVHPCDQGCAAREAQLRQAFAPQHDRSNQRQQLALFLLFDQLCIDQIRMGLTAWLAWAPPLVGTHKRRHHVEGHDEGRQIAREAIAEERRDACDPRLGDGHDLLGGVKRPRPHDSLDRQPKRRGKAEPDPLPPILAVGQAFPCRVRLTRMLARDEVLHLGELLLGQRQVPQEVSVDRFGLVRCPPAPGQHGRFRYAKHKANVGQNHTDQEHLQGHHHFLFRRTEIEKDRLACLRKARLTVAAAKDASFAALGEIRRDSTHAPTLPSAIRL
jgi:hypothetical protein